MNGMSANGQINQEHSSPGSRAQSDPTLEDTGKVALVARQSAFRRSMQRRQKTRLKERGQKRKASLSK
jgi:hypothetical protein